MKSKHIDGFLAIWQKLDIPGQPVGLGEVSRLMDCYSEPNRFYHALPHIEHCLDEFVRAYRLAVDPDAVGMAFWYHDAFYDPRGKENEEQSVVLARAAFRGSPKAEAFGAKVAGLILPTKHVSVPEDPDARLVVDIDLSILGQSRERFDEYERQIREEYAWVPEADFAKGRTLVLRSFLMRSAIYSTPFFHGEYEARARANIAHSIRRLGVSR